MAFVATDWLAQHPQVPASHTIVFRGGENVGAGVVNLHRGYFRHVIGQRFDAQARVHVPKFDLEIFGAEVK